MKAPAAERFLECHSVHFLGRHATRHPLWRLVEQKNFIHL